MEQQMNHDHDPYGLLRLQGRARDVFARAARMQDLHAQAQAQTLSNPVLHRPTVPDGIADQPQQHLSQHAARDVIHAHGHLRQAADLAHQMALTDPVMTQLNARINGATAAASALPVEVLDMDLTDISATNANDGEGAARAQEPPRLPPPKID